MIASGNALIHAEAHAITNRILTRLLRKAVDTSRTARKLVQEATLIPTTTMKVLPFRTRDRTKNSPSLTATMRILVVVQERIESYSPTADADTKV